MFKQAERNGRFRISNADDLTARGGTRRLGHRPLRVLSATVFWCVEPLATVLVDVLSRRSRASGCESERAIGGSGHVVCAALVDGGCVGERAPSCSGVDLVRGARMLFVLRPMFCGGGCYALLRALRHCIARSACASSNDVCGSGLAFPGQDRTGPGVRDPCQLGARPHAVHGAPDAERTLLIMTVWWTREARAAVQWRGLLEGQH